MNLNQIEFLKALDRNQEYGTLQRILLEDNLSGVPFEQVCKHLLIAMMDERQTFLKENGTLRKELVKHGLYTSELMQLEG